MSELPSKDPNPRLENQSPSRQERERRSHPRNNSVMARIEDTTYEVLRRHEKQTA